MNCVPIALILGSDDKPAKMRLFDRITNTVYDAWLIGSKLTDIYKATNGDDTLNFAGEFPAYHSSPSNQWVFYGCNRIPILDMYNNVLEDGTNLAKTGLREFRVTRFNPSDVARNSALGKKFGRVKCSEWLTVIDIFGETQFYPLDVLFSLARKDRGKTLFHNLDYSRLGYASPSLLHASLDLNATIVIPDSGLSKDLDVLCNASIAGGFDIDYSGFIVPSEDVTNADQVIIPNDWTSVHYKAMFSGTRVISFPEEMYSLNLWLTNMDNLESISLPSVVYHRSVSPCLRIRVQNCPKLRELVIPSNCMYTVITVTSCPNLMSVRAMPFNRNTKGTFKDNEVVITIKDCPHLQVQKRKNWRIAHMSV